MIVVAILGVAVGAVVGFFTGVRYAVSDRVLPGVLARMSSERLNDLAARAGAMRTVIAKRARRSKG